MATITLELTGGGVRPLRMIGNADLKVVTGRFTFDSAYLTGGESLGPSDIGLLEINTVVFGPAVYRGGEASATAGFDVVYDHTYNTVVALTATNAEVVSGTDLSTFVSRFIAIGY